MNTKDTLSPEQEEKQDDIINEFMYGERTFAILLDGLEVSVSDEDAFSDAIYGVLGSGVINRVGFKLIQKYMGNNRFNEKFGETLGENKSELEKNGFSQNELRIMTLGISFHINIILEKFDIYNYVGEGSEVFNKNYTVFAKSEKYGDILISRDFKRIYLLVGTCFYNCDNIVVDDGGEISHFLWYFPDHTIHCNISDSKMYKHPGKAVGTKEKGDINGLHSHDNGDEVFTILDTELNIRKSREYLGEGKTQFLDVMRIGADKANIVVKIVAQEANFSGGYAGEEIEEGELLSRIRRHIVHKLYSLTDREEIFSTRGEIIEVVVTRGDTYIITETEEYHPEMRSTGYISRVTGVYSVQDHCSRISGLPIDKKNYKNHD